MNALEQETGVSGEIDVTVARARRHRPEGDRLDDATSSSGVLTAHGYSAGKRCTPGQNAPELCPALSLPDLFAALGGEPERRCDALLDAVPPYFSQGVITPDRKTANLAFGIRLMPLDQQKRGGRRHRARSSNPPPGVRPSVVGLPVLAAEANAALSSPLAARR